MNVTYRGYRTPNGDTIVTWERGENVPSQLSLYLDKVNHSPTGFEWGYFGSGPSQLAFAILYSYLSLQNREEDAKGLYMRFKQDFIAGIHEDQWLIHGEQIDIWLDAQWKTLFGG